MKQKSIRSKISWTTNGWGGFAVMVKENWKRKTKRGFIVELKSKLGFGRNTWKWYWVVPLMVSREMKVQRKYRREKQIEYWNWHYTIALNFEFWRSAKFWRWIWVFFARLKLTSTILYFWPCDSLCFSCFLNIFSFWANCRFHPTLLL